MGHTSVRVEVLYLLVWTSLCIDAPIVVICMSKTPIIHANVEHVEGQVIHWNINWITEQIIMRIAFKIKIRNSCWLYCSFRWTTVWIETNDGLPP